MSDENSINDPNPAGASGLDAANASSADSYLPSGEVLMNAAELGALREKAAEAEQFKDRYLRSVADLENFRKRSARERQEAIQFANQGLMEKVLPVLDNLDFALSAVLSPQGATVESLRTGVEMVLGQLKGVLRDAGLEEIDALGQTFDPNWHEAVSQQETLDAPEGAVVQQLRKGYRIQQRLLRPATVVVARPPQQTQDT